MASPVHPDPEAVMRRVTERIIRRAIAASRRTGRDIRISKTSGGKGIPVTELDSTTPEGRERLEQFFRLVKRHYTFSGLGAPEEKNSINWRNMCIPCHLRMLRMLQVSLSFILKGTPAKNRFYRWMGMHIGSNTEIMQGVWLDHFLPELIFIGDHTLIGAYSQATVHAYEGCGRFRYGIVEIGSHCTLGAGTGTGPVKMGDHVRTLPGTTLSPYLPVIKAGSVVGWAPPAVQLPQDKKTE